MSTVTKCDVCGTTSEDCLGWLEWKIIDHKPRTLADKPLDGTRNICPKCREVFFRVLAKALLDTVKEVTRKVEE